MNANMPQLNREVLEAKLEMDRTHRIWMDTSFFSPAWHQACKEKDAASLRYTTALTQRGLAGGRAYPTWTEASPAEPERY